ncbi:MAG TPA: RHS repeat-associated core domain-containing protein, partial [Vicinamibacterales bacterium]|nr:RHS repeat-associated core domain-containing protein [Vicinamibacterales bacterium]
QYDTASMGVGKPAQITASDGFTQWFTYDSLGRVSQLKRLVSGSYYYVDQTYDGLGRIDAVKYPGSVAGDTSGGPEADANRLRVRNNYNANGYLSSVQDVAAGTVYWRADAADENGEVTQETLGNGRVTKRFFDRATSYLGTLKTGSASNETEVQNLEFGFDQAANLRIRKDSTSDVNGGSGIREEYSYDAMYRLTQMRQYKPASLGAASPTLFQNYSYDGFGNLLTKGTSYTSYCYNTQSAGSDPCSGVANALPHAARRVRVGGVNRDYTFDANGNVTGATNAMYDSVSWYVSNLAKRVSKGGKYSEFSYGPDRARYRQYLYRSAGDTETTIYIGGAYEKLTKVSGGTTTVEHTHYVRAGDMVVALAKRQQVGASPAGALYHRYLHRDHIGSIVAMTDASGTVVERSGFDPWGKRTSYQTWDPVLPGTFTAGGVGAGGLTNGVTSTKRGFTGHEHVEELGFVHMNGRIYDSELGRFFSPDPTMQHPESTQGFNRYSYAGNNPLSNVDPSGFSFEKILSIVATILQFIPITAWIGFILNVVVGFMQGGAAGGILAIASAFIPGGGSFWSNLAIGAAKALVSSTILGAANGYQVSLGQSFRSSLKSLPKTIAIQAISMKVSQYIQGAFEEAGSAGTEKTTLVNDGAEGAPPATQNAATMESAKAMAAEKGEIQKTVGGLTIKFDAGTHQLAEDIKFFEPKILGMMGKSNGQALVQIDINETYTSASNPATTQDISRGGSRFVRIWVNKDSLMLRRTGNLSTGGDRASIFAHEFVHVAQAFGVSTSWLGVTDSWKRHIPELQNDVRQMEAYAYQMHTANHYGISDALYTSSRKMFWRHWERIAEICGEKPCYH